MENMIRSVGSPSEQGSAPGSEAARKWGFSPTAARN